MDPRPYEFSFGATDAEKVEQNLRYLEEVIEYEGGHTIAAMICETVTGTNGVQPPLEGYFPALKKLLDKHGILLICDEVMAGFGRTGKLYAFEHFGVVPDLVTMAKGLTSAYAPLGAVGMSDPIADHFETNVFWGGLTYNSHAPGAGGRRGFHSGAGGGRAARECGEDGRCDAPRDGPSRREAPVGQ